MEYLKTHILEELTIIIAVGSLLISILGYLIAKSTHNLYNKDFTAKQAKVEIYVKESLRFKIKLKNRKLLIFNSTIRNFSENKNSIIPTLEISYLREDNSLGILNLSHDKSLATKLKQDLNFFDNSIVLESKAIESSYLIFEQPKLLDKYRIEKYTLNIIDNIGTKSSSDCFLIKEIEI